jgi:hypothetical protein
MSENLNQDNNQNLNDDNTNNSTEQIENKVFSEDYVKALRGESKQYRLRAKNYETKLRQILSLDEDADISDLDTLITTYQTNLQKAQQEQLGKVKELLFQAELKKLENQYNLKLVNKLLDKSKITVDDNGNISGLQEALKELEKDFPEIAKNNNSNGGANPVLDNQKQKSTNVFDLITKIKTRK